MDPENYQLTRNDFELCTKNAFKNLLREQEFADVTLACSGNKQVKAHKVILGACSPFFKEVLLKNPHQHPLIYLKGISLEDLEAIVKFIYQGQTSISETNLDTFLASAQELQVEGLLLAKNEGSQKKGLMEPKSEMPGFVEKIDRPEELELETIANYLKNSEVLPPNSCEKKPNIQLQNNLIPSPSMKFKCDNCDFESLYRKSLKRHKETVHQVQALVRSNEISQPTNTTTSNPLLTEEVKKVAVNNAFIEKIDGGVDTSKGNALQNEMFKCDQCDFTTKHKWNIKRHVDRVHVSELPRKKTEETLDSSHILLEPDSSLYSEESFGSGMNDPVSAALAEQEETPNSGSSEDGRHHCEQCNFSTTHRKNLRRHVLRVHGNVENDKIDDSMGSNSKETADNNSKSSEPSNDKVPASFSYTCDKCEFTTDNKWNLTRHILRVHKEMKYPCDYCDYKAPQTYRLKEHMQKKHR